MERLVARPLSIMMVMVMMMMMVTRVENATERTMDDVMMMVVMVIVNDNLRHLRLTPRGVGLLGQLGVIRL